MRFSWSWFGWLAARTWSMTTRGGASPEHHPPAGVPAADRAHAFFRPIFRGTHFRPAGRPRPASLPPRHPFGACGPNSLLRLSALRQTADRFREIRPFSTGGGTAPSACGLSAKRPDISQQKSAAVCIHEGGWSHRSPRNATGQIRAPAGWDPPPTTRTKASQAGALFSPFGRFGTSELHPLA